MKIEIQRADNGGTVVVDYDDTEPKQTMVYQFDEDSLGGLRDLLWDLAETLDKPRTKRDQYRIDVRVIHGSDYECSEKGCEICSKK